MITTATKKHYFASCALGWSVAMTPEQAVKDLREEYEGGTEGMTYRVYMVPVSIDKPYNIDGYKPQVEGTEKVKEGRFTH